MPQTFRANNVAKIPYYEKKVAYKTAQIIERSGYGGIHVENVSTRVPSLPFHGTYETRLIIVMAAAKTSVGAAATTETDASGIGEFKSLRFEEFYPFGITHNDGKTPSSGVYKSNRSTAEV